MAIARLMVAMPRPVCVFSGETNSPIDWRAPIVIIRIDEAITMKNQGLCRAVRVMGVEGSGQRVGAARKTGHAYPRFHERAPPRRTGRRSDADCGCNAADEPAWPQGGAAGVDRASAQRHTACGTVTACAPQCTLRDASLAISS